MLCRGGSSRPSHTGASSVSVAASSATSQQVFTWQRACWASAASECRGGSRPSHTRASARCAANLCASSVPWEPCTHPSTVVKWSLHCSCSQRWCVCWTLFQASPLRIASLKHMRAALLRVVRRLLAGLLDGIVTQTAHSKHRSSPTSALLQACRNYEDCFWPLSAQQSAHLGERLQQGRQTPLAQDQALLTSLL